MYNIDFILFNFHYVSTLLVFSHFTYIFAYSNHQQTQCLQHKVVTKFVCYFECYFFLFLPFKIFIVAPLKSPLLIPYFAIIAFTSANADAADGLRAAPDRSDYEIDFGNVILNHLRTAGVQQAHKEDGIKFTSINPFPGRFISGDGRYDESENENASQKRAAIFIGPE